MKVALSLLFISIFNMSYACDICGCAINGNSISGMMPMFNKNLIGLRLTYQAFNHPKTILNQSGEKEVLRDVYLSDDVWLRYYLHPKVQAFVNLPIRQNIRELLDETQRISGVGDISMQINYSLFNNSDSNTHKTVLMWWLGGGIKLPNGKYQQRNAEKTMYPIGFQVGTGAYAYLINNQISVRRNKIGLNWQTNLILNTTNELDYQLGNMYQTGFQAFYWHTISPKFKLLPQIGLQYIHFEKDKSYKIIKLHSGGERINTTLGIDAYINRLMFSAQIQQTVFETRSESMPITQPTYQLNMAYFF
ncbi:MAG: hypothetical protein Q8K70_12975 [Bacteroidota bacterium]|nr:hypothetical protein [Bacteroidota bacterium]